MSSNYFVFSDFSCWEIKAPDQNKTDYSTTKIQIHIETSDKNVKFEEDNNLRIHTDNQQVMLETDRNTYKMGDTVKMRLIAFDFDLKPIPNYKISTLTVRSPYPTNAIVKEWENISTDLGLAHIEFQLAPDTPEGYWSIQADGLYAGFEVKKYILPRFQAIINGPDQIYNDSKSTSYTVCGKYSYGRNIKGVALLAAKIRHGYPEEPTNFSQVKDLKGGCAKFELFSEDLGLNNERTWSVDLTASVTEDGTEQVESISKYVYISRRSYSYRWNYKNSYMKPKLLYKGEFSLDNGKLPVATPTVEMCYKLTSDESKTCSNLTLDSNNHLDFIIPPLKNVSDHSKVEIEARVFDFPLGDIKPSQTINLWHSKSKNGIQIINPKKDAVNCQSSLSFTVLYNSGRFKDEEEVTFKYILTSRGDILNTGAIINKPKKEQLNLNKFENVIGKESYEAEANPVDQFDLELKLDKRIYTSAKLVIYYDYDNEVISDTMDIDVEAEWSEKSLYPGEVGTLDIETEKDSLCSVSSIDKASTFLGSSNRIDTNNVVGRFNRYFYNYALNCIKPKKEVNKTEGATTALAGVAYAMHSVALSGAPAPAAPSTTHIPASLEKTGTIEDSGASVDNRGSAVRSFFPETWLWDLIPVREGKVKVERKLPDSITNWEGSVVCMSENEGIGISDKIEIQGFKPFFVDVLLPYSIKRNKEILHLPIPVFNYLNHSLPIRVTLETSKDIVLVDGQDKNSFTMCLEAEDSYTHNYRIKATKLGNLDITVSADSNPAYAENCAPKSIIQRR
ncbi:macroglobulin / complement [Holotrichia oblita]|uniref:Macroglobulin / complement n=1 Tax=Holotrichia oblita TaxID=644536 RepID=A0ACB9TMJ4_HOLOL|nr:macroglobulin / complement [Holotrichia oblita]